MTTGTLVGPDTAPPDRGGSTLELFFDLVFVFGITQVTAYLAADHSGAGFVQGLLIMALLWWVWVGFAWLGTITAWSVEPKERSGADQAELARDGYSYLHLLLVAGIVLIALGLRTMAKAAELGVWATRFPATPRARRGRHRLVPARSASHVAARGIRSRTWLAIVLAVPLGVAGLMIPGGGDRRPVVRGNCTWQRVPKPRRPTPA